MVQPDPQDHHEKLIRIRSYRPSDSEQVRELFKNGIIHGPNSPLQVCYNTQLRGLTACTSYCAVVLGLLLATFLTSPRIRYIGIALCIAGCALFAWLRYTISSLIYGFVNQTLSDGDLKDIGKTFEMKPIVSGNGESTGEYVPSGSSGFWVAEAYEKGSEMGDSRTEVVGALGLDANNNSDTTNAELRRMVVSPNYRRHGIALSLLRTALDHAQNHGVTSIVLWTPTFHLAAIAMYEKFGWVRQRKHAVGIVLDRAWLIYYSLDLTAVKI